MYQSSHMYNNCSDVCRNGILLDLGLNFVLVHIVFWLLFYIDISTCCVVRKINVGLSVLSWECTAYGPICYPACYCNKLCACGRKCA